MKHSESQRPETDSGSSSTGVRPRVPLRPSLPPGPGYTGPSDQPGHRRGRARGAFAHPRPGQFRQQADSGKRSRHRDRDRRPAHPGQPPGGGQNGPCQGAQGRRGTGAQTCVPRPASESPSKSSAQRPAPPCAHAQMGGEPGRRSASVGPRPTRGARRACTAPAPPTGGQGRGGGVAVAPPCRRTATRTEPPARLLKFQGSMCPACKRGRLQAERVRQCASGLASPPSSPPAPRAGARRGGPCGHASRLGLVGKAKAGSSRSTWTAWVRSGGAARGPHASAKGAAARGGTQAACGMAAAAGLPPPPPLGAQPRGPRPRRARAAVPGGAGAAPRRAPAESESRPAAPRAAGRRPGVGSAARAHDAARAGGAVQRQRKEGGWEGAPGRPGQRRVRVDSAALRRKAKFDHSTSDQMAPLPLGRRASSPQCLTKACGGPGGGRCSSAAAARTAAQQGRVGPAIRTGCSERLAVT